MKVKKTIFHPLSIFVILGIIGIIILINKNNIDPLQVNLNTNDGQVTTLTKIINNKPTLLVFWASWCPHCKNEIAVIDRFATQHPEINVVGLQVDNATPDQIFQSAKYKMLYGAKNSGLVMTRLGNTNGGVPYIVLLSPEGKVLNSIEGEANLEHLDKMLDSLVFK